MSWVGEDGPEVIIPLSGKKKDRGLELWKQAGDILGASEKSQNNQRGNSSNRKNKQKVSVSVKNITISEIKNEREKNSIAFKALKEQKEETSHRNSHCECVSWMVSGGSRRVLER